MLRLRRWNAPGLKGNKITLKSDNLKKHNIMGNMGLLLQNSLCFNWFVHEFFLFVLFRHSLTYFMLLPTVCVIKKTQCSVLLQLMLFVYASMHLTMPMYKVNSVGSRKSHIGNIA